MKKPSETEFYTTHLTALSSIQKEIASLYSAAYEEFATLVYMYGGKPVDISAHPNLQYKIEEIGNSVATNSTTIILGAIDKEWALANQLHDLLADWVVGDRGDLPSVMLQSWYGHNDSARANFISRVENGLNLSERIWKTGQDFTSEMVLVLESGIYEGKSAAQIAKALLTDLNEPNHLYRKVRQTLSPDRSVLVLSKAASLYHPGRGYNRSSYQNALRLAKNEVNFSYEGAARLRRIQQDFIVGTRIKVSHHHNPALDRGGISCSKLQGDYPADFDFTYKWHVNCLCIATSIMKTREELDIDLDRIYNGYAPMNTSVNLVTSNPASYTEYVEKNYEKWQKWKNLPRFVENNL